MKPWNKSMYNEEVNTSSELKITKTKVTIKANPKLTPLGLNDWMHSIRYDNS
jgi:hypothetical protein